jgi:hypothetical protein
LGVTTVQACSSSVYHQSSVEPYHSIYCQWVGKQSCCLISGGLSVMPCSWSMPVPGGSRHACRAIWTHLNLPMIGGGEAETVYHLVYHQVTKTVD